LAGPNSAGHNGPGCTRPNIRYLDEYLTLVASAAEGARNAVQLVSEAILEAKDAALWAYAKPVAGEMKQLKLLNERARQSEPIEWPHSDRPRQRARAAARDAFASKSGAWY
jgi:hypothetical protein